MGHSHNLSACRSRADIQTVKIPPFILVHERGTQSTKPLKDALRDKLDIVRTTAPSVADSLQKQTPALARTLIFSSFGDLRAGSEWEPAEFYFESGAKAGHQTITAIPLLARAVAELERQPNVVTVGIWDLGSRVGRLSHMIEALNTAQAAFAIFQVEAAIPAGMISRPERVAAWIREKFGQIAEPKGPTRNSRQHDCGRFLQTCWSSAEGYGTGLLGWTDAKYDCRRRYGR